MKIRIFLSLLISDFCYVLKVCDLTFYFTNHDRYLILCDED